MFFQNSWLVFLKRHLTSWAPAQTHWMNHNHPNPMSRNSPRFFQVYFLIQAISWYLPPSPTSIPVGWVHGFWSCLFSIQSRSLAICQEVSLGLHPLNPQNNSMKQVHLIDEQTEGERVSDSLRITQLGRGKIRFELGLSGSCWLQAREGERLFQLSQPLK